MRRLMQMLAVLVMAGGGLVAVPVASANADSIGPYLGWRTFHATCGNQDYFQLDQRGVAINRDNHNTGWVWYEHTQSATGELQTDSYYENAVVTADRYYQCSGRRGYYSYSPTRYVHRRQHVNLNCHNGGCALLYKVTTDWSAGTIFP